MKIYEENHPLAINAIRHINDGCSRLIGEYIMSGDVAVMNKAYAVFSHTMNGIIVEFIVSSKKGDGKKLLLELSDKYENILLESDEFGGDALLDYYYDIGFVSTDNHYLLLEKEPIW
jgi:hypothetical protein